MNILREKQRTAGWNFQCSSAPDTSGLNRAAEANAGVAKDALEWYKQQYTDSAPARAKAAARADEVSGAQLDSMRTQTGLANEAADYNRNTFRPLERGIVSDAQNFDTEQERERLAGLAQGDVHQSFANARAITDRSLERRGVNPADGAYGAGALTLANSEALAGADASNKARSQAMVLGRAMKMDAASLGRGLPSQQATSAGLALSAGNSAVGNAQVPLSVAGQGADMVGRGYTTAIQGNSSSGNLYAQQATLQNQNNDGLWGAVGNVAGKATSAYIMSDENEKEDRAPVKGEVALAAARKLPVETWRYRKDSPANDGGKVHAGPMAQKVRATLGDAIAPGGKMVDVNSMNAMTLAAVKALDKKVTRMEKRQA